MIFQIFTVIIHKTSIPFIQRRLSFCLLFDCHEFNDLLLKNKTELSERK